MKTLRVATFQRHPIFEDTPSILARLGSDLTLCDLQDVQVAVFPECYLQGYCSDRDTIQHRAISTEDQVFSDLLNVTARFKGTLIIGFVERKGRSFYNSAAVITKGRLQGLYSKIHVNEPGFDTGESLPIFVCDDWSLGVNICNDANFPTTALQMCAQGARLLCYPLNNMLTPATAAKWRDRSVENLRQRAIDTGCWVISSDVVGEQDGKISYGCTCIVRPDGVVVSKVDESAEGQIFYDLS